MKQDKIYVITAIDSIKCKNTPCGLVELIQSAKIRRLDIPDFVLKFEIRPILDENYNLTEFGEIAMMSLCNNFAYLFPKGYINWDKYNMTMLSFHFIRYIGTLTFKNRLDEVLKILRETDPVIGYKQRISKRTELTAHCRRYH